jgi:hypothetical protein
VCRYEFERDAGRRQADASGWRVLRMPMCRHQAGLGRAQERNPWDRMADRVAGKLVEGIADMLSDARAGILQDPDAAEEVLPQRAIAAQPGDQFLVTLRDIRVEQRRDFAQVTNRLLDLTRQRLAVIDIKRPPLYNAMQKLTVPPKT